MPRESRREIGRETADEEEPSAIERRFLENSDIARQFDVEIDIAGPASDDAGFFLVKRQPTADPEEFRSWLLSQIGERERVLLETATGIFVIWARFGEAHALRDAHTVELVGGVSVDVERLQQSLSQPR